ncbi:MAG TPA: hypothetical protein VKE22_26225 [Haliangiales bacterium]|nr:hypothetical protein [Haliangiales bacterium]
MRRPALAFPFLILCSLAPARAEERFTIEASLGLGVMVAGKDVSGRFALAPIGVTLGTFVFEKLAVGVRLGGTVYFGDPAVGNSFLGIVVQPWLSERLYLEGGLGVGVLHPDLGDLGSTEQGFGLSLRGGYIFARAGRHAFSIFLETYPSFYSSRSVLGATLGVEWQFL